MAFSSSDPYVQQQMDQLHKLVQKRLLVAGCFSFLLLVLYALYGYLMSVDPSVSAALTVLGLNRLLSLCLLAIVTAICVAGGYSWWTNKIYDPQITALRDNIRGYYSRKAADHE